MNLWIVGQVKEGKKAKWYWEYVGVFDSKEKAVDACRDETYFVGPTELNNALPHETVEWEGAYYPKSEGEGS